MSTDSGGSGMAAPPPPGYPPTGYLPPGYPPPGYPPPPAYGFPPGYAAPPGFASPGYAAPPAYGPPPGFGLPAGYGVPGYGAPGYGAYVAPPLRPGVIPLRPLSLSDIFNGAVSYVRANPKATLGLTTIVVVITQLLVLLLSVGPLAASGQLGLTLTGDEGSTGGLIGSTVSNFGGAAATWLASILLSGLLTVVVGRAVFGAGVTIGESWQRLRGRFWALIGFTLLEFLGAVLLIAAVVGLIKWVQIAAGGAAAAVIALPLVVLLIGALLYLGTMLTFVPPILVLERLGLIEAIKRSFTLVKKTFWRVLGIWLLALSVALLIAGAVAIPFSLAGQLMLMASSSTTTAMVALILLTIGGAIGQIITAPFSAGVVVLQYTDSRIRTEAFDLVLRTGAQYGPGSPPESTDHLWLTRRY
jgi:Membrane domain of glycerophosphoryl diester phosphodiesterase